MKFTVHRISVLNNQSFIYQKSPKFYDIEIITLISSERYLYVYFRGEFFKENHRKIYPTSLCCYSFDLEEFITY